MSLAQLRMNLFSLVVFINVYYTELKLSNKRSNIISSSHHHQHHQASHDCIKKVIFQYKWRHDHTIGILFFCFGVVLCFYFHLFLFFCIIILELRDTATRRGIYNYLFLLWISKWKVKNYVRRARHGIYAALKLKLILS